MKTRNSFITFGVLMCTLCIYSPVNIFAQGCGVVMTQNYSFYDSYSENQGHIYTSALVEGSASCSPTLGCPCNTATHTPKVLNKLGSVGGWSTGPGTCVNCYISYHNDQNIAATPGVEYLYQSAGQIVCSIAGVFFSGQNGSGSVYLSLAFTTLQLVSDDGHGHCGTRADCAGGVIPRCTSATVLNGTPCNPGEFCGYVAYRTSLSSPFSCLPGACVATATLPGQCTPK
jgi:hypothetical protein